MLGIFPREQGEYQRTFIGNKGCVSDFSQGTRGMLGPFQGNKGDVRNYSQGTRGDVSDLSEGTRGDVRDLSQGTMGMLGTFPRKQGACQGPREQGGGQGPFLGNKRGCQEPFLRKKGDVRNHSKRTRGVLGTPPREQGMCQ